MLCYYELPPHKWVQLMTRFFFKLPTSGSWNPRQRSLLPIPIVLSTRFLFSNFLYFLLVINKELSTLVLSNPLYTNLTQALLQKWRLIMTVHFKLEENPIVPRLSYCSLVLAFVFMFALLIYL